MSEVARSLGSTPPAHPQAADELLPLVYEELRTLAAGDPVKAEILKLRYFAGLSQPEIATALGLAERTVQRHWAYARSWLYAELKAEA